jgi:hypothetical protein
VQILVGRKAYITDIVRPPNPVDGLCTAVIEEQDVQAVGKGLRKRVYKEVEGVGTQIWQFQEKALPCDGGHSVVNVGPLAGVLDRPYGLELCLIGCLKLTDSVGVFLCGWAVAP